MSFTLPDGTLILSQDPDDNLGDFFPDDETTMQGAFFDQWMTKHYIEEILSEKDIEMLNCQLDYSLGDDIPDAMSFYDIFPCTELPYVLDFYNYITYCLETNLTPKAQAICLLKANVLCACQIIFGLPFWHQKNALEDFENALAYLKKIYRDNNLDATFEFVEFCPVVIQKKVSMPAYEAELVFEVLKEYMEFAAAKGYFGKDLS